MGEVWSRLIVCFEDPFWIGVFERIQDGKLAAAKVTFGSEPKDYEVSEFILRHYYSLQFSPAVETAVKEMKKRQMENTGIGTKSQQALKLQQEQNKKARKVKSREKKLAESERRFEMKQQKKKEKHRGR